MSVAATARRNVPEARRRPDRLAFKTAEDMSGQMLALDDAEGIITAIVSVTGTVDEVNDIIVPGAYRQTLTKRNPKVCWAHSWEHPIGRTLHVEELLPGDPRLPAETKDGLPWPADAGALVATMQFNLRTREGKDAFEAARFYSETGECEYSIGYQVPAGAASRRNGIRYIKALDLYELSVVLFGAHTMTGTLSIKAAVVGAREAKRLGPGAQKAAETFVPPKGVQSNARRGLDLRKANNGKGGTAVGVARARTLANGQSVPLSTVKRMASYFARHEADKSAEGWGSTSNPSPGYVAWLLWGGDAGKRWSQGVVKRAEQSSGSSSGSKALPASRGAAHAALAAIQGKAAPPFTKEPADGETEKVKPNVVERDDLPEHDADTNLTTEDCPCGDLVVFDTTNGWQRLDGSYSHDDGTTHSDHLLPPDTAEASNTGQEAPTGAADGKVPAEQVGDVTGGQRDPSAPPKPTDAAGLTPGDPGPKAAPDFTDGVMVAVYPDPAAADAIAAALAGPDNTTPREELHVTLAFLGNTTSAPLTSDEMVRVLTEALEGEDGLTGTVGGIGQFPADENSDNGAPTWVPVDVPGLTMLRETIVGALGQDNVSSDHGFTPHMTIGWDLGLIEPLPSIPVTFTEVRVVYGDQARTIPLGTVPDPESKARSKPGSRTSADFKTCPKCGSTKVSHTRGSDQPRCANCGYHVPLKEGKMLDLDGRTPTEIGALTAAFARWDALNMRGEVKAEGGADRNRGGAEELRQYWTTGEGGAKIGWNTDGDFTRCVALLSEHMTPERAKGYCANRHKEMTGMWPGDKGNKGYDPALDGSAARGGATVYYPAGKAYPHLAGSDQERLDRLSAAATEALRGEEYDDNRWEWDHVTLDGSYSLDGSDRLYATRHRFSTNESETFEMTFRFVGDDGVELGQPNPVDLRVVPVVTDDHTPYDVDPLDMLPLVDDLGAMAAMVKSALGAREGKAGRVLSGRNERELRAVVENLVNVLARAGVRVQIVTEDDDAPVAAGRSTGESDPATPVDSRIDTTTTSPSAAAKSHPGMASGEMGSGLTFAEIEETLARLREGLDD